MEKGITASNVSRSEACDYQGILSGFTDSDGRLTALPAKRKKKLYALCYLADKLERGAVYTEKEFNTVLGMLHTFSDPATLRRELYDYGFIDRSKNGSEYCVADNPPTIDALLSRYM